MSAVAVAGFTPTFLYMLGGLIAWAVRFLAVYGFTAVACARGWSAETVAGVSLVQLVVFLITLASALACASLLVRAAGKARIAGPDRRFIHLMAATVAALAIVAIVWETLPFFLVPVCAP